jgi:hypothetical protein
LFKLEAAKVVRDDLSRLHHTFVVHTRFDDAAPA